MNAQSAAARGIPPLPRHEQLSGGYGLGPLGERAAALGGNSNGLSRPCRMLARAQMRNSFGFVGSSPAADPLCAQPVRSAEGGSWGLRRSVRVATPMIHRTPTTRRNKPKGHSKSWDESASNTKTSPITTKTSARILCIRFTRAMYTYTHSSPSNCPSRTAAASGGNVRGLQRINQHPRSAIARSSKVQEPSASEQRRRWPSVLPTGPSALRRARMGRFDRAAGTQAPSLKAPSSCNAGGGSVRPAKVRRMIASTNKSGRIPLSWRPAKARRRPSRVLRRFDRRPRPAVCKHPAARIRGNVIWDRRASGWVRVAARLVPGAPTDPPDPLCKVEAL
jgi:hypothetical protein